MVAITDPDRSLRSIPHHDQLREVFLNPPDVGRPVLRADVRRPGPRGAAGHRPRDAPRAGPGDGHRLRRRTTRPGTPAWPSAWPWAPSPQHGRDKLTFVIDRELAAFGPWVEQLIAESTGKHGVGVVPVDGEPLGAPAAYGNDRVFVRIALAGSAGPDPSIGADVDARLAEPRRGRPPGHPHRGRQQDRDRRRVRPLGGRHRARRRRAGHRPVRPAQRRGSQEPIPAP